MKRMTVKRADGRWAIANNDGATNREQLEKFPIAINRLAAYEDTGMEPEDIRAVQEAMAPIPFSRFRDIMEAERAGRLVLPSDPNPPLTLEELREMGGEPVWFEFDDFRGWSTIKYSNSDWLATWRFGFLLWEEYGQTWLAYKNYQDGGS